MSSQSEQAAVGVLGRAGQISFVVFMLGLTALFVTLGMWQVQRLGEKETLIANVETRMGETERAFPDVDQWSALEPDALDYRPYRITGTFDHDETVLIFHNLVDPQGQYGGVGYWVMAPLTVEDGGIVWVNRGFVPESLADSYATGGLNAPEQATIRGVARRPERSNAFTPGSDLETRREWVRDPERLTYFLGPDAGPVAPVTLDQAAGDNGTLPQGGETAVRFPNRHLEYAGTWFLFAAITPIMLGFWIWRQRKSAPKSGKS